MAEAFINVNEGTGKKIHHNSRTIGADLQHDEFVLPGEFPYASYTVVIPTTAFVTANSHLLQIMAGASLNVRIRRIQLWQSVLATATLNLSLQLWRLSTAGTGGTAVTPGKLDTADAAAGATAMTLPTAKGTELTQLYWWNPVADIAWTAGSANTPLVDYEWKPGLKPIIIPAGAANGIAIKNINAQAVGSIVGTVELVETNFV
jgi:hypothetical protein